MSSFFDSIFDDVLLGFGKPRVVFNTNGIKDMMPNFWKSTDYGYRCTAKTLGINESDIVVTVEDYGIKLFGESEVEGKWYNTTLELPIAQAVMNDLIEIKTNSKNGLTFVDLYVDMPKKKTIKINGKEPKKLLENK